MHETAHEGGFVLIYPDVEEKNTPDAWNEYKLLNKTCDMMRGRICFR